jgi:N-dimethylarginine dimethylaminohydrolase
MSAALLMCSPEGFAVNYEINLWMKKQVGNVIREVALSQWQALFNTLSGMAEVQVMPGDPTWPDLVFTANAGLPVPVMKRFILSNFKHPQRQGEKPLNRAWFESRGWECVELPSGVSFEGAGDALVDSRGILWLGYGFRSDAAAATLLARQVMTPIRSLQLIDPAYYHLDTCFCPLSDGSALYLPEAFAADSRQLLEGVFGARLIELTPAEGRLFCANAVEVGGRVVMNAPTPRLRAVLESRGFAVAASPLSEFIKSGGGAKCLTLRLDG